MPSDRKIRVLVVDDSALVRTILRRELSRDPQIEVVGAASDAYEARDLIVAHKPDLITLDVEMPRMSGLDFLDRLMKNYPVPVIMFSTLTDSGTKAALEALEKGAVDVMRKPDHTSAALREVMDQLIDKIKAAHGSIRRPKPQIRPPSQPVATKSHGVDPSRFVVAIGASTGGTEALRSILTQLPADMPPTLIVQHMPEGFTNAFAERLNKCSRVRVMEALDNIPLKPGLAIIGHGNYHLSVEKRGSVWYARSRSGPLVCRHRPSVEVLFQSMAKAVGSAGVGVILTGMGADGADGMLAMHQAGAATIAQDERSCVVFGMPKEAIARGGVDRVVSLNNVPRAMISALTGQAAAVGR
ncbi:MAG: chemotaxis response regulator protein-glutamate methylesterase [Phycisphaerae bacterium]|nr:chemotaxis response regulator protein-glutamate methylesterase [Phycisphaerae bacterium]